MRFKIYADVLYSHYYEIEAASESSARVSIEKEDHHPAKVEQVCAPVVVSVKAVK